MAENLMRRITLPPGFTWTTHESDWGESVIELRYAVNDVATGQPVTISHNVIVDEGAPDATTARAVLDGVVHLLAHEAREWVTLDGVHVVDPHPV